MAASLDRLVSDARRYNELLDSSGMVRAHWRPLIDALGQQDASPVRRGAEHARRLIVENGVTYNVYGDPQGRDRPWMLDPVPMLVTAAEWSEIEVGVMQRARLLDALLADLYGPQRLLADGTVPPQIPFGHPNYLWPCAGLRPLGERWLQVYAADIARSVDGQWWVLADRTQTPSGTGYALENRQIISRVFPELIADAGVRSLGAFFAALRDTLLASAPSDEAPFAVVLTPGAFNETYYEHAYLARQLGLPLVEGHDLTVRSNEVFLKTLGGLRRVHAILRRLDDDFCDPLELRADSALGVPGLIGAVRAGRVAIANALGTGVLESAAWMGFLPAAASRLLGEKLALPSVATWWCGEPPALRYVLENMHRLVIKPTYPNQLFEAVFGRQLSAAQAAELAHRIRARPHAYVAQEHLAFSQAPVWNGSLGNSQPDAQASGFAARALGIRVYAVATESGYRVMPGGLARIAADRADVVSMQRGGGSKDVWVLAERRSYEDTSVAPGRAARHDDLASRLAENLFWLGRYSERCEDKARLLRATLIVRGNTALWPHALEACRQFMTITKLTESGLPLFEEADALGLRADMQRLAWCASQARSRLSAENWRAIGVLQRDFNDSYAKQRDTRETLDAVVLALAALAGFALDDMTQDDGWRLMMIGRRLERLQFLAQLLAYRLRSGASLGQSELEWLLDIGDSTITYRTRYLAAPHLGETIDLLVFDQSNPRALAYQWRNIRYTLVRLAASLGGAPDDSLDEAVALVDEMQMTALDGDSARAERARHGLAEQLAALAAAAARLSDRLTLKHFTLIDSDARIVAA